MLDCCPRRDFGWLPPDSDDDAEATFNAAAIAAASSCSFSASTFASLSSRAISAISVICSAHICGMRGSPSLTSEKRHERGRDALEHSGATRIHAPGMRNLEFAAMGGGDSAIHSSATRATSDRTGGCRGMVLSCECDRVTCVSVIGRPGRVVVMQSAMPEFVVLVQFWRMRLRHSNFKVWSHEQRCACS